jgi:heme-degrading monooxygenase HmoA
VLETIAMNGFRQRVVPVLEQQPGFEGYLIVLSRDKEELLGITLWDTEEKASRQQPGSNRSACPAPTR